MARGHIIELGLGGGRCERHVFGCPWGGSNLSRSGRVLACAARPRLAQRTRSDGVGGCVRAFSLCPRYACYAELACYADASLSRTLSVPEPLWPSRCPCLPAASTRGAPRGPCSSGGAQRARLACWQRASRPSRSLAVKRMPASPWGTLTGRATW
jgi:hypothetical protein